MNYYNDIDAHACRWTRELIKGGLVAPGHVECCDIKIVAPWELSDYKQVHLFNGISGWPLALRLAGWDPDEQVWTGSCPCQPISVAGKNKGEKDERHLWPEMFRLIRKCRPGTVFGEQIAGTRGYGWLDRVFADLESQDYACWAVDLPACAVGAPHIRHRLYWAATLGHADGPGWKAPQIEPVAGREGSQRPVQSGAWDRWGTVLFRDWSKRRFKPGAFPLSPGFPGRVATMRAIGNSIIAPLAAKFIKAHIEGREVFRNQKG